LQHACDLNNCWYLAVLVAAVNWQKIAQGEEKVDGRSLFAQQMDCVQGWRVPTKLSGLPNAGGETESQTEETIEFTKRSMLSCSQASAASLGGHPS